MKTTLQKFYKVLFLLALCLSFNANAYNNSSIPVMAPNAVPVANFSLTSYTMCAGNFIYPADMSTNGPTAWQWSFPGASGPTTSTVNNPSTYYLTAGVYTITLTASNISGTSTPVVKTITVVPYPSGGIVASPSNTICSGNSATLTAPTALTYTWSTGATTQSIVVSPTTYSVYWGSFANGACANSPSIGIYVNASPSLVASANPTSICAGNSVTLTASGATSYTWSNNTFSTSTIVNPSVTSTYTVAGSNGTCTVVKTLSINVTGMPVLNVTSNASVICSGNSATLSVTGAPNYTWSTSATTSVIVVSPTITTTYTVVGANNCFNSIQSFTQNVSTCTSLQSLNGSGNEFVIYPNPSNGVFNIKSTSDASFFISNELGQIIKQVNLNSTNNWNASFINLESGIYFIIGRNDNQIIKQKVVITK